MQKGPSKGQKQSSDSKRAIEYRARKEEVEDWIKHQIEENGSLRTKKLEFLLITRIYV